MDYSTHKPQKRNKNKHVFFSPYSTLVGSSFSHTKQSNNKSFFFIYSHVKHTQRNVRVRAHTHTHKHTHKLNNLNETSKSMRVFQRENMLRSLIEKGLRLRSLHLHGPYFQALLFVSAPDNRLSIRSVQRRRQSSIRIITLGV